MGEIVPSIILTVRRVKLRGIERERRKDPKTFERSFFFNNDFLFQCERITLILRKDDGALRIGRSTPWITYLRDTT